MGQDHFFDFKEVASCLKNFERDTNNEKVFLSEIKTFRIEADRPHLLLFKYNFQDAERCLDLFQRKRRSSSTDLGAISLKRLYNQPLTLSSDKFNDLWSLCERGIIPPVYHQSYALLPHE